DEWRMLAEQPAQDQGKVGGLSWFGRKKKPEAVGPDEASRDVVEYRRPIRTEPTAGRFRRFCKRAAIGLGAILLLWGASRMLFGPGSSRQSGDPLKSTSAAPAPAAVAAADDLPAAVASLPAVVVLQRNDPQSYERFKKRYADSAPNARDEEVMSAARAAL